MNAPPDAFEAVRLVELDGHTYQPGERFPLPQDAEAQLVRAGSRLPRSQCRVSQPATIERWMHGE